MDEDFDVVIHHGGKLIKDVKLRYEGGETSRFKFDPDVWSYFVIVSVVKSLGYEAFKDMWYSVGGASVLDDKLECLCDDKAAMHMVNLARLNGEVHMFVIHPISEPEVIHMLEYVTSDERGDLDCEQQEMVEGDVGDVDCEHQEMGEEVQVDAVVEEEVDGVEEVEVDVVVEEEVDGVEEVKVDAVVEEEVVGVEEVEEVEVRSWNSSFENGNGDGNLEDLVDVNVGCDIERSSITSFTGSICPKILSRFRKESELTKNWIPSWSGNKLFEVRHMYNNGDKYVVNIDESSCTCRIWELTGIPCCHSLAAMKFLNIDGVTFIDSYYFKSKYEETYSTIIYPINRAKMWNLTPYPDVYPPHKRVLPGRPKRKRKLEQWEMRKDESRMTKSGLRKRCRICRQHGHNRTRCPSATQPGTVPSTSATQATTSTQQSEIAHESQPQT